MASDTKKKSSSKGPTPEEIINGFQALRNEQRSLSTKLTEFEADSNEHKMVIATLENVDAERRCFRLVGGILTERKVKDVLPALKTNLEKLNELIEKLKEQISKKGVEINEYREKYNISFQGLDNSSSNKQQQEPQKEQQTGSVLVS